MGKRTGFLKKSKSITGKSFTKPSIKPSNTRKIIRRYHLLLNKKDIIYQKLSHIHQKDINDSNIGDFIKTRPKATTSGAINIPTEQELLSASNETSLPKLYLLLEKINYEIIEKGGLSKYQIASIYGQESKRGSDSSKWLFETIPELKEMKDTLKVLEIGSLSTQNVVSKYANSITRIDLNSNEPSILKQDFMERPLPKNNNEKFNLISCSLVLNFVPTAKGRGEMMQRFEKFLDKEADSPLVFIVLPLSCIKNSRYCDKAHFEKISNSLGYELIKYSEAKKLVYMVLKWTGKLEPKSFPKKKLHDGPAMNNFSIIIEK
ncbi:hypothetical protein WICANDRAFT_47655 [Wickerhamomyces anomalus NRRL Y-366-8]|uniref:25S rRNA adenine-N(1) methyltransferase n=1 Tax=Wickerhamomyces anomalus (strain ATCC 58044 / CBS 1984 / NCYC 433 / NRRL Y-366-8) TaxID=683960 RepID=A0A1E3NVM3_WICAA|nr:uncharacterized protein WICANDRAFT_47655 [Wickerhamomyces anomalus NRRL Y-366-8]ODQ57163.1 hypothetical protein WICANDRAFT_47655 [Wickerhamomyces anomalus NRRL Y-366-8]